MALPSSVPISLGQVNEELGKSPTAPISLNDADVRSLAGVPSGPISMSDLHGKSSVQKINITIGSSISGTTEQYGFNLNYIGSVNPDTYLDYPIIMLYAGTYESIVSSEPSGYFYHYTYFQISDASNDFEAFSKLKKITLRSSDGDFVLLTSDTYYVENESKNTAVFQWNTVPESFNKFKSDAGKTIEVLLE